MPRCYQFTLVSLRQGSNERDSSSPTERVSPVILSEAKDLSAERDRPFASLRVTRWDSCNCEGLFFTTEPCLSILMESDSQSQRYSSSLPSCFSLIFCQLKRK